MSELKNSSEVAQEYYDDRDADNFYFHVCSPLLDTLV